MAAPAPDPSAPDPTAPDSTAPDPLATDPEIASLGAAIGVSYVWALASMAITLLGTSLLGFRLEVLVVLLFATLGVIAVANFRLTWLEQQRGSGRYATDVFS